MTSNGVGFRQQSTRINHTGQILDDQSVSHSPHALSSSYPLRPLFISSLSLQLYWPSLPYSQLPLSSNASHETPRPWLFLPSTRSAYTTTHSKFLLFFHLRSYLFISTASFSSSFSTATCSTSSSLSFYSSSSYISCLKRTRNCVFHLYTDALNRLIYRLYAPFKSTSHSMCVDINLQR